MNIAVLAGGVGAARFLRGLCAAVEPSSVTAIVNTGDDWRLHGLAISPDLDTVTYTLANAIDPERGWGLVDESWNALAGLERYEAVRPTDSLAATRWFGLGDRDLATHLYRTARLDEGGSLTTVTDEIRRAWGVAARIVPMSDQRQSTIVETVDDGDVAFQDYFVRLRHGVPIRGIRFEGEATVSDQARQALHDADRIVIAPSNPIVSIGPIRHLAGVDDLLAERRASVVAVSPIVGGAALKGPADRMLRELGYDASVAGIAGWYAAVAGTLVVDTIDADATPAVEAAGMHAVVTESVMSTPEVARQLAVATLQ
ncbi:MAG: 2-phospho-L-lactate transferase [Actinomycetota bacterium]